MRLITFYIEPLKSNWIMVCATDSPAMVLLTILACLAISYAFIPLDIWVGIEIYIFELMFPLFSTFPDALDVNIIVDLGFTYNFNWSRFPWEICRGLSNTMFNSIPFSVQSLNINENCETLGKLPSFFII